MQVKAFKQMRLNDGGAVRGKEGGLYHNSEEVDTPGRLPLSFKHLGKAKQTALLMVLGPHTQSMDAKFLSLIFACNPHISPTY